ncbi:hypothetical protein AB0I94_36065 [Streptomyces sp. NPDC050147]|uniref:hypothetical protein n=1 Tax=Streptomyces sp. NPDC050147 TaxID=3155513 RepID=UPI00341AC598
MRHPESRHTLRPSACRLTAADTHATRLRARPASQAHADPHTAVRPINGHRDLCPLGGRIRLEAR